MVARLAKSPETCGVRDVLDRVGDKWSLAVVNELGSETRRFSELQRAIDGVSHRMLTSTLRNLERDGLVERTVFALVPPRVDYRLTPLGRTFLDTAWALMSWAQKHCEEIRQARETYDATDRS